MKIRLLLLLALAALLAGCAPARPDVSINGIEVSQARLLLPGGDAMSSMDATLAAYMTIKNSSAGADRLTGASVDFGSASLHETRIEANVMKMDAVPGVDIPAGQILELRSGSYHIMVMNLTRALKVGESVNIVLEFEKAGQVSVPVKVTDK